MSESDPVSDIEAFTSELEQFCLHHKVTESGREKALAGLIKGGGAALEALAEAERRHREEERRHRQEERRLRDRIARLEERAEVEVQGNPYAPKPEILARSRFLKTQLAGLGGVDERNASLMEERPGDVPSGLESLAGAMAALTLVEEEEEC